jgi:hypothetical protein
VGRSDLNPPLGAKRADLSDKWGGKNR